MNPNNLPEDYEDCPSIEERFNEEMKEEWEFFLNPDADLD